jgi:hypothetical protein
MERAMMQLPSSINPLSATLILGLHLAGAAAASICFIIAVRRVLTQLAVERGS